MSYISEHPTRFRWRPDVRRMVGATQARWPWQTFINTYYDHPPDLTHDPRLWPVGYYDEKSFDVWGGGGTDEDSYSGYRGKPLDKQLGDTIFHFLFSYPDLPDIDWIIYRGRMWWNPATGGHGWQAAPGGPADSDPGHFKHIHCTYR